MSSPECSAAASPKASCRKKIRCRAKDPESGIAQCKLQGLRTSKGKHTVTVVATNGAGVVTKKKFRYTIG